MPRVIGLTGGIGVGKSTVAAHLARHGAIVVDCDQLGRDVVVPGGRAHGAVIETFGSGIAAPDGSIDRAALARIVFSEPEQLARLNAVVHPAIDAEIAERITAADDDAVVVLDMAVLTESDLGRGQYQEVLVVEAPREQRLERLIEQRGMSREDAEARMASQATDAERRRIADHVLVNGGDLDRLAADVDSWWSAHGPTTPTGPDQ
ncbi:MAG: dephospho-CoA kinase [Acidimicrobiales bacterium]